MALKDPQSHLVSIRQLYRDRKSTRLNSSHSQISYAVFCLKKKISDIEEVVLTRPNLVPRAERPLLHLISPPVSPRVHNRDIVTALLDYMVIRGKMYHNEW